MKRKSGYRNIKREECKKITVHIQHHKGVIALARLRNKPIKSLVDKYVKEGFAKEFNSLDREEMALLTQILMESKEE